MDDVKRWHMGATYNARLDNAGYWVRHSDYAALQARLAKAEMDSRSYQAMAADAIHRMDNAQAEVARLSAALATAQRDALEKAAEVCTNIIRDYDVMKPNGTTYEPVHVQRAAKGMVSLAREDIRADLALDPLADPRVEALVEAVTLAISCGVIWRDESDREFQTPMRCYEALQARVAELEAERDEADDLAKAAFADGASNNILLAEAAHRIKLLETRAEEAEALLATARRDAAAIARSFSCCHVPDEIAALIAQEEPTT